MKRLIVMLMVGLLFFPLAANADFQERNRTFTLSGSGESESDLDKAVISMQASAGYFIKDHIELALRQGLSFSDTGDDSNWTGSTRLAADYYIPLNLKGTLEPLISFLGVNIGYRYGDDIDSDLIACPEVGLKYFLNDTTFISAMAEYEILLKSDVDEWDDAFSDGRFIYSFGMGIKF